jgi:hypothetical protein
MHLNKKKGAKLKMTQIRKIEYRCLKSTEGTHLKGFIKGKIYKGRSFNGLFEISPEWASHYATYLIEKREFDQYFELVEKKEKMEI